MAVLVEAVHALLAHKIDNLLRFREGVLNADVIVLLDGVEELIRLGVQPAGVKGEHAVLAARQVSVLNQGNVFSTGESDCNLSAERGQGVVHDLKRRLALQTYGDGFPVRGFYRRRSRSHRRGYDRADLRLHLTACQSVHQRASHSWAREARRGNLNTGHVCNVPAPEETRRSVHGSKGPANLYMVSSAGINERDPS